VTSDDEVKHGSLDASMPFGAVRGRPLRARDQPPQLFDSASRRADDWHREQGTGFLRGAGHGELSQNHYVYIKTSSCMSD